MNKTLFYFKTIFTAFSLLLAVNASFAEPANLALLQKEVQAYHDSGTYEQELAEVIKNAQQYINQRARENKNNPHPEKLAVVLDIDETSISNYDKMVARQFVATKKQLYDDIRAANSPSIQPMLLLYQEALKQDVKVFFVTGRKESEREPTIKNLKFAGYSNWAGLYLKPDSYNDASIIPFKSKTRAAIASQGYTIIASIGDQFSDIQGGFAEKGYKLPNPYYYLP